MEMVVTTKITYKYLMNKSKHDLAYFILTLIEDAERNAAQLCRCEGADNIPQRGDGMCLRCNRYRVSPGIDK